MLNNDSIMKKENDVLFYMTENLEDWSKSKLNIWNIKEDKLVQLDFKVITNNKPYFFEFGRIVVPYQ